ncbi:DUF222 domain-containing protein [Ilumatobacter sp.]|uniref:HNH endonuclease signature motif containing protein n=4 Tax=Ilumatobacter sp. TaxID=1967498 RepID=UPI003298CED7
MLIEGVIERAERVMSVRADSSASTDSLISAMRSVAELRSFLAAAEADLALRLRVASSFAEPEIAAVSGESLSAASRVIERGETLAVVAGLAEALDDARLTAGHVDAVTRGAKSLEPSERDALFGRIEGLVEEAGGLSVAEFARRVRREADEVRADDGMGRLERQRRATSMSTWTDDEGMWNVRGRFDPVTALSVSSALERAVEALFAEAVPESCPSDPIEKQKHLRALAFGRLVEGGVGSGRPGRPEFVAVIDADAPAVAGAATVEWPIPIEVPQRVLASLVADADVTTVVVRNGVVLHAPGNLDLGRATRLANRAQRRALRGLYATCAIPGCSTGFDRCKLHHVVWWRNGGATDLDNLLPVCSRHHHAIHDGGWNVQLGPNRELTLTLPDGTVRNTGPPSRRAA